MYMNCCKKKMIMMSLLSANNAGRFKALGPQWQRS